MKYPLILCVLLSWIALPAKAQNTVFNWVNNYSGSPKPTEFANSFGTTTDVAGNVYTVGNFEGTVDFDPGPGTAICTTAATVSEGFITKTSPDGKLIWVKRFTTDDETYQLTVTADKTNGIYIAGTFDGNLDADPGPGTTPFYSAKHAIYVIKLDTAGTMKWARAYKDPSLAGNLIYPQIGLDRSGNILLAGRFTGTPDFDPGTPVYTLGGSCAGAESYIMKWDRDGNFKWAKRGGEICTFVLIEGFAVDSKNNIYLTGTFDGTKDLDPGPGVFNQTAAGGTDVFVSKLDSNGNFIKAIGMGGAGVDGGYDIRTDVADNLFLTGGYIGKADFKPGPDTSFLYGATDRTAFVAKYDSSLNFKWAKSLGGVTTSTAVGISLDCSKAQLNIMGAFDGTVDFDPGKDTAILRTGKISMFIARMDTAGKYTWAGKVGDPDILNTGNIHADAFDNLYCTGSFEGSADFDPGAGVTSLTSAHTDEFLLKLSACVPFDTVNVTACRSYTLDGHTYTKDGTYTQTIKTERKCETTRTINLKLTKINDTVTHSGNILTPKATTATGYQWVRCPGYTPIPGASSPSYMVVADGDYAVIITDGACKDTSDCIKVKVTGLEEMTNGGNVQLWPNPTRNTASLIFTEPALQASIELLSLTGNLLHTENGFSGRAYQVDLNSYPAGLYLLRIRQPGATTIVRKLVKQ